MAKPRVTINPQAHAQIAQAIGKALDAMALGAAEQLDINTSEGPRSGRKYSGLPNTSSAPTEYPQEQFGNLNDSVDTGKGDHALQRTVGFFGDDLGKLIGLEFKPLNRGGRKPIARTMMNPDTHERMKREAEK